MSKTLVDSSTTDTYVEPPEAFVRRRDFVTPAVLCRRALHVTPTSDRAPPNAPSLNSAKYLAVKLGGQIKRDF